MVEVPQLPLKEFFKLFAPTYVLGTTYTISLAFFEGLVYPEISRTNLRRCLLLCDKVGFQRATVESNALRSAGREYMALCAPTRHSFHPKVWLMIGSGRAALLVGSGNLTQSGFMDNTELFDVVQVEEGGSGKSVAADAAAFVAGLRSLWPGSEARRLLAIETLDEMRQELEGLSHRMPDDSDPDLRLLSNFTGPLVEQFGQFCQGGTLRVAAPYFGGGTDGVELLRSELALTSVQVFPAIHAGGELDVSVSGLKALNGVSVHSLKMAKKSDFAHLKAYGFESDRGRWMFTTSANCTLAALGGDNVEAGLLRRVDRETLAEYFAEQPSGKLPTTVRAGDYSEGGRWLHFWAVDRGSRIEFIVGPSDSLPIRKLIVTVRSGGVTATQQVAHLFVHASVDHIEWDAFDQIVDRAKHTPLISLEGIDAGGREIRGDALVDNPLLLSSDPTHRSAWRAAVALLEGEGLPESSDLASIFHLVQGVFDVEDEKSRAQSEQTGSSAKSKSQMVIPDKIPIWPPTEGAHWYGAAVGNRHIHDLQWFQRILAEFLNPRREADDGMAVTTADSQDDEVVAEAERARVPARVVKAIWKQAASSYEQMRSRLGQLEVTGNTARKVWAVAMAVFVATLLTRRQLLPHAESAAQIPTVAELIRDFVTMLFVDRLQSNDDAPQLNCRYRHATFPSLAEDLHSAFDQNPPHDIAGIICLLFAHWSVTESRVGRQIPTNAWLLFREVAPRVADGSDLQRETLRTVFEKYVYDESEGISWSDIEASLDALIATGWAEHDGYRQLNAIMRCASGHQSEDTLPSHLVERWPQTKRRIERRLAWHFDVDPLCDTCAADGCSGQYVTDPKKRRDLRLLAPTICSACGAVLIPERLWQAYRGVHE